MEIDPPRLCGRALDFKPACGQVGLGGRGPGLGGGQPTRRQMKRVPAESEAVTQGQYGGDRQRDS